MASIVGRRGRTECSTCSPVAASLDRSREPAQITVKRNSFYVTLGLSRLLFDYSTAETMELYNLLIQDPERVHEDSYYRSRKGRLLQELKERFGELVEIVRGRRGEERFRSGESPERYFNLVKHCLIRLTPWSTFCVVPVGFDPLNQPIPQLCFNGRDPDDEHRIEVARMHSVLHPDCYERLACGLNLDGPASRLEIPHFFLANHQQPPHDRHRPPRLEDAELNAVKTSLAQQAARRKVAAAGLLRILVDKTERARLDPNRAGSVRFRIEAAAELIEVRALEPDGEIRLATYLFDCDESSNEPVRAVTRLAGSQKICFTVSPARDANGEISGALVEVALQETDPIKATALFLRRLKVAAAAWLVPGSLPDRSAWRPALTYTLLALCALGLLFYFQAKKSAPQIPELAKQQTAPTPVKESPPASPPPAVNEVAAQNPVKRRDKTKIINTPFESPSAQVAKSRETRDTSPSGTVSPAEAVSETTRATDTGKPGATLLSVSKVYVETSGDDLVSRQVRQMLLGSLATHDRLNITYNRDESDAVLKVAAKHEQAETVTLSAQLVNVRGDVIWPTRNTGSAGKYRGAVAEASALLVRELLAEIARSRR